MRTRLIEAPSYRPNKELDLKAVSLSHRDLTILAELMLLQVPAHCEQAGERELVKRTRGDVVY